MTGAAGPPGAEGEIRQIVAEELRGTVRECVEDHIGNLYVRIGGTQAPRVMISAHMDEIGMVVVNVEDEGFIRVAPQGLFFIENCHGAEVTLLGRYGNVEGIAWIGGEGGPLSLREESDLKDLYIDVGASSAQEAAEKKEAQQQKRHRGPLPKGDFAALVSMLVTQALFSMGLLQSEGQKKEPDLELAKYNIDMLETLQEKSKGNLSPEEEKVLEDTLSQVRMAYVKVVG